MRFQFSIRTTAICGLLALGMIRASFWQWDRHLWKQGYIQQMNDRIAAPVQNLEELLSTSKEYSDFLFYRRVKLNGEFLFEDEIVLRNRRLEGMPGVFVITPFRINNTNQTILVQRGFLPLAFSEKEKRKDFQHQRNIQFYGLIKPSQKRKIFSPQDPDPEQQRVDRWLRVNIPKISKQLSYSLLPFYIEWIDQQNPEINSSIFIKTEDGKNDILFPGLSAESPVNTAPTSINPAEYPRPTVDTVISPGRHLGYVFEWAFMALVTVLIGLVLQLKRPHYATSFK